MKLYGKNPVLERLKSNPSTIRRILIEDGHAESAYIFTKAKQHRIPVSRVPYSQIQKLARNVNTQGIMADVDEFAYADFFELLETAREKKLVVIFLDNLTDPQNLGGIIRTAGALGNFAIVLPTHDSVEVTEAVLRVACGGENNLSIAIVSNLANAITKAKENGFWIAGTVTKAGAPLTGVRFQFPMGLVLGSEDKGVREVVRKKLDCEVMIPMKYERMSLNVAHAASILCWEITRQRP